MTTDSRPAAQSICQVALVVALLSTALATHARAQGPHVVLPERKAQSWTQSLTITPNHGAAGIIGSGAKDHRYTGMYIGLGTAALAGILGTIACTNQDTPCNTGDLVLGITAFAAVAGTIGAMIGHAFPKHPPPATSAPGIE